MRGGSVANPEKYPDSIRIVSGYFSIRILTRTSSIRTRIREHTLADSIHIRLDSLVPDSIRTRIR